ncbi:MAG TPA: M23 family metallopeptidase [Kofleriaceae bacterium]|nr:M23 family metallopeptidase [Kofleriaceae bacterium]
MTKRSWLQLCIAIVCLLAASEARAGRHLEGTWRGTLGEGAGKLRLVLTLARSGGDAYSGVIDSIDQGATIPIDKVSLRANRLTLEVGRVGGAYDGVLGQNDTRLSGTWRQGGVAQPLAFQKDGPGARPPPAERRPAAQLGAPLDVEVPIAPTAFRAGGKQHLVYELHITNLGGQELTLKRVEALVGGRSLSRRDGLDLAGSVLRPGVPDAAGWARLRVGPGLRAVVFMWITLDGAAAIPAGLDHRIVVTAGDGAAETSLQAARIAVRSDALVIGPPLRGGDWVAANGPSHGSGHRRALIPVGGRAAIAQRFAIDWVRLRPDGRTFAGDQARNRSYRAYGAEALAVADGVVVAIVDGIPENVPGLNSRAVPMTLDTLPGNHVIVDIGRGRFALYAHLQPRSLRVKRGDRVRRGQVLGLVGNSGNSTEPHLHFHVTDSPSPLGSEGIPYLLSSFDTGGGKPGAPRRAHRNELPLENDVVTFRE